MKGSTALGRKDLERHALEGAKELIAAVVREIRRQQRRRILVHESDERDLHETVFFRVLRHFQ